MNTRLVSPKMLIVLALGIDLIFCGGCASTVTPEAPPNVMEGSSSNQVATNFSGWTISGGGTLSFPNQILGDFGVIGGGMANTAGNLSTVGGGTENSATGIQTTIAGGANNLASQNSAVVVGGYQNTASQMFATVGGGIVNVADGAYSTISGGSGNRITNVQSTIGGGSANRVKGAYATIAGGYFNGASGGYSTVAGGTHNLALGTGSAISGGVGNSAGGLQSMVGGGLDNTITDNYSVVSGGRGNKAGNSDEDNQNAAYASVGGGNDNEATGIYSTIPGGFGNQANGNYSFAAGNLAFVNAQHTGTTLFSDSSPFPFNSIDSNEFAVRATGGVRFVTALDETGAPLSGVRLMPGSGTWETLSDRNVKTGILHVNNLQVLYALMKVPVSTWQYKGELEGVTHMGPMAQDFYTAFGLGQDRRYIGNVDESGVALAAIQGLYQISQDKDVRIAALQAENADQTLQIRKLEERMTRFENSSNPPATLLDRLVDLILMLVLGLLLGKQLFTDPSRHSAL